MAYPGRLGTGPAREIDFAFKTPAAFVRVIDAQPGTFTYGTPWSDQINGSRGPDVILAGGGDDTLTGGADHDILDGEDGDDVIDGGGDYDWIDGGAGDDTIHGGAGNDQIDGETGDDRLTGGTGADQFWFDEGDGQDVLTDYEMGVDTLYFFGPNGASVDASLTLTQAGLLIAWGDQGDTLLLEGVSLISALDFQNVNFI